LVNRPFYAFGLLMAFLALAMLAIGLSSRPSGERPSAGGSRIEIPGPQPGVTTFVLVLPDAADEDLLDLPAEQVACQEECGFAAAPPSYEQGCGLDRATGEVHFAPARSPFSPDASFALEAIGLRPATIEPADPMRLDDEDRDQLTTGYDAAYDEAMSAVIPALNPSADTAIGPAMPDADQFAMDEPDLLIFESLCGSKTAQAGQKSYLARFRQRRWDYEAKAIASGAVNRVWQLFIAAGVADEWMQAAQQTGLVNGANANKQLRPTWAEYEAWIGSKQWTVAGQDTRVGDRVAFWSPPKDELLQIAVAGLNRVAELLHEALARFMGQTAERIAERTDPAAPAIAPK
jgi:hypothetical protein